MYNQIPFTHPKTVHSTVPLARNFQGTHLYTADAGHVVYHLVDEDLNPTVIVDFGMGRKVEMVYPDFTCVDHRVIDNKVSLVTEEGAHVKYSTFNHSLKQEIVINKVPTSREITEILYLKGLSLENDNGWKLIDNNNEIVAWFVSPSVVDSAKNRAINDDAFQVNLDKISKNSYKFSITLSEEFLDNAKYPIIVDPTITTGNINDSLSFNDNRTTFTMSNGDVVVIGCNEQQVYYTVSKDSGSTWSNPVNTGFSAYELCSFAGTIDTQGNTLFVAAAYPNVGVKITAFVLDSANHTLVSTNIISQGMYRNFSNIDLVWNSKGFLHLYTVDTTGGNTYLTGFSCTYANQTLTLVENQTLAYFNQDTQSVCSGVSINDLNYVLIATNNKVQLLAYGKQFSVGSQYNELSTTQIRSVGTQYVLTTSVDANNIMHIAFSTGTNTAVYFRRTAPGSYTTTEALPLNVGNSSANSCTAFYQGQLAYEQSNNSLVFLYNGQFNTGDGVGVLSNILGSSLWETYNIYLDYPSGDYAIAYISIEPTFKQEWSSRILFESGDKYVDQFLSGELQPTLYLLTSEAGKTYDEQVVLTWNSIYVDNITLSVKDKSGNIIFSDDNIQTTTYTLETLGWSNGLYTVYLVPFKNGAAGMTRTVELTILHVMNIGSLNQVYPNNMFIANTATVGGLATWNNVSVLVIPDTDSEVGGIYYSNSVSSTAWKPIYGSGLTSYSGDLPGQGGITIIDSDVWGLYVDSSLSVKLYTFPISEETVQSITDVKMYDLSDNEILLDPNAFAISTDGTNILIYDGSAQQIRVLSTSIVDGYISQANSIPIAFTQDTTLNHQFGYDGSATYWGNSSVDIIKYTNTGSKVINENVFSLTFDYLTYDPIYDTLSGCVINNSQNVSEQQIYTVSSNYLLPPMIIEPARGSLVDQRISLFWQQPEDPYSTVVAYDWFIMNSNQIIPSGAQGIVSGTSMTVDLSNEIVYPNDSYAFYISAVDASGSQSANTELNFILQHSVAPTKPIITFVSDVSNLDTMNSTISFTLATNSAGTDMTGYVYWIQDQQGNQLFAPRTVVASNGDPVKVSANMVSASNGSYQVYAYATGSDREGDVLKSSTSVSTNITVKAQFASPTIISWPAESTSIDANVLIAWQVIFSPYDGRMVNDYYYYVTDSSGNVVINNTTAFNSIVSIKSGDFPSGVDFRETYTLYLYGVDSLKNQSPSSTQTFSFTPTNVVINYDVSYPYFSGTTSSMGTPVFYQYPGDGVTLGSSLTFSTYIEEYVKSEHSPANCYCQWYVLDTNNNVVATDTFTYTPVSSSFEYSSAIAASTIDLSTYTLQDGLMYTLYVQQVTDKYSDFASITFFANQQQDATYFEAPIITSVPIEYAANTSASFGWDAPNLIISGTVIPSGGALQNYYYEVTDPLEEINYVNPTSLLPNINSVTIDTSDSTSYKDGDVYQFSIKALNNKGVFGFSNRVNFLISHKEVLSLPEVPIWILPISNVGTTMNPKPHFQFKLSDPLGNTIEGFRLQVATDQNFNDIVFDSQDVHQPVASDTVVSYIPTQDVIIDTSQSRSYFVRVYGWNNNGNGLPSMPLQINFQAASWMPLTDNFLTVGFINQLRTTIEASLQFYGYGVPTWLPIRQNGVITFAVLQQIFDSINILLKDEGVNAQFVLHRGSVLKASDLVSLETDIMES